MGADIPASHAAGSSSDDELVAAARQGDSAALETLLVRYQPHLYRFGLRMCGNVEDAGDVAQESLISMARSVRDFRGDSSVSSWLYTIARRFCIKKRRRSKFAPTREESLDAPATDVAQHLADPRPNPEQTATNRELATALTHAIDALDPSQREVLVLRDVEGLSAPEVATILDMSVDAVKSRLHRARVAMREEIPSNVTLAAEFAKVFDGFSIGSNDLTQLILGVDRDSELVAHLFDERNDAVTQTIAQVIRAAHAAERKIGICGQAPSDYPEFAQFLVAQGIDSISLNPDSVLKTMLAIVEAEKVIATGAGEGGQDSKQLGVVQASVGPGVMVGTNR